MKNTLALISLLFLITGCDNKQGSIGSLSGGQTKALQDFSGAVKFGLLAIQGDDLFEAGETKLSKSTSDWLENCEYLEDRDGRNRINGHTVRGNTCPISAQWRETTTGNSSEAISISYLLKNANFGNEIQLERFTIRGNRIAEIEQGEIVTTTKYAGTAKDYYGQSFKFSATRTEMATTSGLSIKELPYSYDMVIEFGEDTFKGRMTASGTAYVNGSKISQEEFQSLFFVLK